MKTERKNNKTLGLLATGLSIVTIGLTANSADIFSMNPIGSGGEIRSTLTADEENDKDFEMKSIEAKCGEKGKTKEAKCGESKCGEKGKAKETKCGEEGKTKEAKCGEKSKTKEAKCGEGKCGE